MMTNPVSTPARVRNPDPLLIRLLRAMDTLDLDRLAQLCDPTLEEDVAIEELVVRSGLADERQIASAYADHYLMPFFDPSPDSPPPIDPSIAYLLPRALCLEHKIAPLSDDGQTLEVALFAPDALLLADEVKMLTGRQMRPLFAPLSVIERLLKVLYEDGLRPVPGSVPDRRISHYLNGLFEQALRADATDLHLDAYDQNARVRMRVDGHLLEIDPPPQVLLPGLVQRVKQLAKIDAADSRQVQEGTFGLRSGERRTQLRVSCWPNVHGERLVIHFGEVHPRAPELSQLGLESRQQTEIADAIRRGSGLVLVTGPDGAGKRTTLQACLNALNHCERSICTIEESVVFKTPGIHQVETSGGEGVTFASAVTSFLRQDSDVILVGEIDDRETAAACLRGAIRGRLVMSTLHVRDALGSVARLREMGADSYVLASSLQLLVSQRLMRRLCDRCKQPYPLKASLAQRFAMDADVVVHRAKGCSRCHQTGYRGRVAIFEVLPIESPLRERIEQQATTAELRRAAAAAGMRWLHQHALDKVAAGETSLEEAISLGLDELQP